MNNPHTVLVTGGASGIGYTIVEAVLAAVWRAVIADLARPGLDRARGAFCESGTRARHMFLLDSPASGFVTGQTVTLNGGFATAGMMNSTATS